MSEKIWAGVFDKDLKPQAHNFIVPAQQVELDQKMLGEYINETQAHNYMLWKIGVLTKQEAKQILQALEGLRNYKLKQELGDIHENIEYQLVKKLGDVGKKFHTGRSRNDQTVTDAKLYLRKKLLELIQEVIWLEQTVLNKAGEYTGTIMPGYTHMQIAQPMTPGFWLGSYAQAFERDLEKLWSAYNTINTSPLGAGASFGVPYAIDRELTSRLLGFDSVQENSLDAISSRGEYAATALSSMSFLSTHLGKLATELILFSTQEFGFIKLDDEYATGSSIMPQKKNPDVAELIRALPSTVQAELFKCLSLLGKLPSGYQRDSRETKTALAVFDNVIPSVSLMKGMVKTMKFNKPKMKLAVEDSFCCATSLADLLVIKGIPFRDAHKMVGKCIKKGVITPAELGNKVTQEEISKAFDPLEVVKAKQHIGGTAPKAVIQSIAAKKKKLALHQSNLVQAKKKLKLAEEQMKKAFEEVVK